MAGTFRTCEVLAEIHSFPMIVAARDDKDVLTALYSQQKLAPEMANVHHVAWYTLSRAMMPVLSKHFSALASERYPDRGYWDGSKTSIDPEKTARLKDWVLWMEEKYGATQEIPEDVEWDVCALLRQQRSGQRFG